MNIIKTTIAASAFYLMTLLGGNFTVSAHAALPANNLVKPESQVEAIQKETQVKNQKLFVIIFSDGTPYVEFKSNGKYEIPIFYDEMSAARAAIMLQKTLKDKGLDDKVKIRVFEPKIVK